MAPPSVGSPPGDREFFAPSMDSQCKKPRSNSSFVHNADAGLRSLPGRDAIRAVPPSPPSPIALEDESQ